MTRLDEDLGEDWFERAHDHGWWAWRQQSRQPQQKAQRAIGQLGARERTEQSGLMELDGEPAIWLNLNLQARLWKRGINSLADRIGFSDRQNRLDRRRQVPTLMTENRRPSAKPWNSRWRIDIGAELVVKTPTADRLP